jgi:hypothetical protein
MTEIDFEQISAYQRYKLMASLIVPRPIALVTTLGPTGVANAAPFSMFNMVGEDPPIVMISINRLKDGRLKDTAANILRSGEFEDQSRCPRFRGAGGECHAAVDKDSQWPFRKRSPSASSSASMEESSSWE